MVAGKLIVDGEDEAATSIGIDGWNIFFGREVFVPMPRASELNAMLQHERTNYICGVVTLSSSKSFINVVLRQAQDDIFRNAEEDGVWDSAGTDFSWKNVPAFVHTKVTDISEVFKIFLNDCWIVEFEQLMVGQFGHAPVETIKIKFSQIMVYVAFVGCHKLAKRFEERESGIRRSRGDT